MGIGFGIPPDERQQVQFLYLDSALPSFHIFDPELEVPTTHLFRWESAEAPEGSGRPLDGLTDSDDRPLVYVTLGTVFNRAPGLLRHVINALADEGMNVVVTTGPNVDMPATERANVRIVPYLPQAVILPRCDLVVSHGGYNTMMGAVAHGVPSLMLVFGADQPLNGRRVAAAGAGKFLWADAA